MDSVCGDRRSEVRSRPPSHAGGLRGCPWTPSVETGGQRSGHGHRQTPVVREDVRGLRLWRQEVRGQVTATVRRRWSERMSVDSVCGDRRSEVRSRPPSDAGGLRGCPWTPSVETGGQRSGNGHRQTPVVREDVRGLRLWRQEVRGQVTAIVRRRWSERMSVDSVCGDRRSEVRSRPSSDAGGLRGCPWTPSVETGGQRSGHGHRQTPVVREDVRGLRLWRQEVRGQVTR